MKASLPQRIIIEPRNAVYFPVPKVACSSIKQAIAKELGLDISRELIHRDIPKVSSLDYSPEQFGSYFKFGFVRNPFDRLVSCYKSKFWPDKQGLETEFLIDGVNRGIAKMHGDLFWGGMSFKEFVFAVGETSDDFANEHFRSQYTFLYDEDMTPLYDKLGRFENIGAEFNLIAEEIGMEHKLGHYGNQTSHSKHHEYFDTESRKVVENRFEEDLELLEYIF